MDQTDLAEIDGKAAKGNLVVPYQGKPIRQQNNTIIRVLLSMAAQGVFE